MNGWIDRLIDMQINMYPLWTGGAGPPGEPTREFIRMSVHTNTRMYKSCRPGGCYRSLCLHPSRIGSTLRNSPLGAGSTGPPYETKSEVRVHPIYTFIYTHTHTHTHTYIYICIYIYISLRGWRRRATWRTKEGVYSYV